MNQVFEPALRTGSHNLELDVLTAQVGRELVALALLSTDVQQALSLCHFAEHTDPRAIRGLQRIDRITQALEDLGHLMQALSLEVPEKLTLSAAPILSRLRLHELLVRLDPVSEPVSPEPLADTGDIQWL